MEQDNPPSTAQLRIMLADDDKDDRFFFKEVLKELPLSTNLTLAHDGEELMKLLTEQILVLPDVLFLDLNMPRKDGFACLDEIKQNEKLISLPVIIYSTSYDKAVASRLFKKGAFYYIRKPIQFLHLKNVIQQALINIEEFRHGGKAKPAWEQFLLIGEYEDITHLK